MRCLFVLLEARLIFGKRAASRAALSRICHKKPRLKAKDKAMFNGIYNNYQANDRVEGKM
nr:hypothetical protein [uncultured Campylobacter sp.]